MSLNEKIAPPVDLEDFFDRFPNRKSIKKLLDDFVIYYPELLKEVTDSIEHGTVTDIQNSAHKIKGVLINLSIHRGYSIALDLEKRSADIPKKDALAKVEALREELGRINGYLMEKQDVFL
jgi:HPt (histidine-containing phosphotransfer) domain-containing protein